MKTYSFSDQASFEKVKKEFLSDFNNEFRGVLAAGPFVGFDNLFGTFNPFRKGKILNIVDFGESSGSINPELFINVDFDFEKDAQHKIINIIQAKTYPPEPGIRLKEFNKDLKIWEDSPKQGILIRYINAAQEILKNLQILKNQQYYEDHKDEIEAEKAARLEAKKQREIERAEERSEQSAKKLIRDLETIGPLNIDAYTLGWLAAHTGGIYAVIPERAEYAFSRVFPNAPHRVIPHGQRTRKGDPMQFGASLSIRLKGLKEGDFIPAGLTVQWSGGRPVIYGNNFIIPLVKDYGFHFTSKDNPNQDVTEIVKNIPLGADEDFYDGLGGDFPTVSDNAE